MGWFDEHEELKAVREPAMQLKAGDLIRMETGGHEFTFWIKDVEKNGDELRLEGEVIEDE